MQEHTNTYLLQLNKSHALRTRLREAVTILSVLVILGVFWWLKLTGITMSGEAFCGMDEHVHGPRCQTTSLVCALEEHEAHVHTESCILQVLVCGKEAVPAHTHDESCLSRELTCTEPAQSGHVHDESCRAKELTCTEPTQEDHTHTDSCRTKVLTCTESTWGGHRHDASCRAKELICTKSTQAAHTHTESCRGTTLICSSPESSGHSHGDGCYTTVLSCTQEVSAGHSHGSGCYSEHRICGQDESEEHTHSTACMSRTLTCATPESGGHSHGAGCYTTVLSCTQEVSAGHSHGEGCYAPSADYICGQEEAAPHVHTESCYALSADYICGQEETAPHVHGDECYTLSADFTCGQEETAAHIHTDECYTLSAHYTCAQEEAAPHVHTESCYTLVPGSYACGLEETAGHTHTAECYQPGIGFACGMTQTEGHIHTEECLSEQTQLGCGKQATPGHRHSDTCYSISRSCTRQEHIHVESCYSVLDADLETRADWESTLPEVAAGTTTADQVVAVAESQLGCTESTLNFQVDAHGVRRGISRYGQWYGNPYGDWSAMFASFCLHYAGVPNLPANAGPESMRLEWEQAGLYIPVNEYIPKRGNLIFLHKPTQTVAAEPTDEITEPITEFTQPVEADGTSEPVPPDGVTNPIEVELTSSPPPFTMDNGTQANAVAIIKEVTDTAIIVIEGDLDNTVAETSYPIDAPMILGYGLVPEMSGAVLMAAPRAATEPIAQTITYNANMFTASRSFVIYATSGGNHYAIDGNGNAVPITIDDQGNIFSNVANPDSLLWNFTRSNNAYIIQNLSSGRYFHPYYNSQSDQGVTTSGNWTASPVASGGGALIRAGSVYAQLNSGRTAFAVSRNQSGASVFQFGAVERITIWLDGTQGNLMSLRGSDKQSISAKAGDVITLPSTWTSPEKYAYTLNGWYDVKNGIYYKPGAELTVTENLLLYADWVAATYDIGQMNADVSPTVSTAEFITTRLFDYNSLFNTLSLRNDYSGGDSARWTMVEDGIVPATGEETLNFIFVDHDSSGSISYPVDRNQANGTDYTVVTPGLYNDHLAQLLFDPDTEVVGKRYLGLGDHLFQYGDDPTDTEHYGYYYYDSRLHAASYHQTNGRFYVYDYLERTTDSANNSSYADFLPLNSPYANTNGKSPGTYTYNGDHNEYGGTTHYSYDAKYSDNNNSTNRIGTNYAFGMVSVMEFYLPSVPGTRDADGTLANQSITGEDMVFEFTGDDDVWVLIDGELVLDIGGIHGEEAGSIDFSTGEVIVDGTRTGDVTHLSPGSHTLTMYYLERGASMSNFKLRFNLSTRYALNLHKEDTLTAHLLNGAEFTIYTNEECTIPAELWPSRDAHSRGEPSSNTFVVEDGVASMWGLAAGNTYYFVETRGPDTMNGMTAHGIVRMRLNNQGRPDFEVLPEADGELTVGFTAHGFKVNEDTQEAYLVISNTEATDSEPTQVYVQKVWDDRADHSNDSVTVYLLANGIRIQTALLNESTNWEHTWVNLPKTDADGNEVNYTVWEATVPGYFGTVEPIQSISSGVGSSGSGGATAVTSFENGETYILQTDYGYIGANNNALQLESSQSDAIDSDAFLWVATVNGDGTVTLKNKTGHTFYYDNYTFRVSTSPGSNRNLHFANDLLYSSINYGFWRDTQYPVAGDSVVSNVTHNNCFYTTNNANNAMAIRPMKPDSTAPPPPTVPETDAPAFRITNTPAGNATVSLTVHKAWDLGGMAPPSVYEALTIRMRLLADGADSGLVGLLSLRNGWSYTFSDLPKSDSEGNPIQYTVEEELTSNEWHVRYGPVTAISGSDTKYETTVTNVYHSTPMLPETGGWNRHWYTLLGSLIILSGLGWYCGQRRKDERREC